MSWSLHYIGKPDAILTALDAHADKIGDTTSRAEYEAARPALQALVAQNFDNEFPFRGSLQLEASGHGVARDGQRLRGNCSVSLKSHGAEAV